MLFSIFIFGCMQDKPILEKKADSVKTHVVQDHESNESLAQEQAVQTIVKVEQKTVEKQQTPPIETLALEKSEKPEKESKNEMTASSKAVVKSKKVAKEQTKSSSLQNEIVKTEEKPKAKKKVQYSKPNQQCVSKIKKVLKDKNGEISYCYDMQKFKNPTLEGSITVQINVHKSRNSIWVKKDTMKDKGFRSCMKSKIRDWDFGPDCRGASFKKSYKLVSG